METQTIPIKLIERHAQNARERREYRRGELRDLIGSIRQHGLLQPLVVATAEGGRYTLLPGHRRHAALKAMRAADAPCVVLEGNDEDAALAVLLTDNAQHKSVDPLKEADAVLALVDSLCEQEHPHDHAARILGKSPTWVRGRLRLTTLSPSWREASSNPESPISQFPVGHLELIAALAESVQEQAFEQWNGCG